MEKISTEILNFILKNRVSALAVELLDGTPHVSAVHFSCNDEGTQYYIQTNNTYRKCEALLQKSTTKASLAIGFDETDMKAMQIDGNVEIVKDDQELDAIYKIHYSKLPDAEKFKDEEGTVFLRFTPKWWRYTDFTAKEGVKITNSDGQVIIED